MSSLAHDTKNDTRFSEFMSDVRELGRNAAQGKDSLPNLAMAFCRAVQEGVIDMAKDSNGKDGAARVFEEYAKAEGKKAIHDRTETGLKANVSKLRQIGNFAGNPKWDAIAVLNTAHIVRQYLKENDVDVKAAYPAFVDVAREQLKQDTTLTDAQIEAAVMKSTETKEVTVEGELKKIAAKLEKIITGENAHGIKDQSPEVMIAAEQINQRLAALMSVKQMEDDDKQLAAIMARRAQQQGGIRLIEAA
jgi:hypothetical protein